jgi:Ca-activated chloride channel family protein
MISEFHFIRPLWFLALLPCGALLVWFYLRHRYKGRWADYVKPQLWGHVLTDPAAAQRMPWLVLLALGALLAILALAGPSWQRLPQPVFRNQGALIVALDLSSSMDSRDIKPSRLQRAKHKLLDILQRRREGQTALIVYAGAAFAVTPLTDDVNTIRAQAVELETQMMPAQGSRPDLAVDKALELFVQGGIQRGHLLLITDHIDGADFEPARDRLIDAGHGLSILGVGTTEGAPVPQPGGGFLKDRNGGIILARLNETELRRLASYRRIAVDDSDINYLLPDSNPQLFSEDSKETGLQTDTWRDEGPWLLLPLLLLTTLAFRRGLLLWAGLLLFPWTPPAQAFGWRDLWLNDDQRGERAFEAQQYETAEQLFDDPEWRAASAYRRGDYEQAAAALAEATTADALYNRGNALARLGRVEEAVDSYNRALEQNPQHEDARYNRDVLLQQQQQQQQNPPSGQDSKDQNSRQNQDSQQQNQNGQPDPKNQDAQQQNQSGQSDSKNQDSQNRQQSQDDPQADDSKSQPPQQAEDESQQEKSKQQQQPENPDSAEKNGQQQEQSPAEAQLSENADDPERQQREQWLRLVPDDPGGLLKRKFQYQYRRQQQEQQQAPERDGEQEQ